MINNTIPINNDYRINEHNIEHNSIPINSEVDHNNEFCLKGDILDEEATDVRTKDPDAKVKQEVDQVVRTAISKLISQAI